MYWDMFSYWDIYEIIIYQLDVTHVLLFIIAYYLQFQLIYIYHHECGQISSNYVSLSC